MKTMKRPKRDAELAQRVRAGFPAGASGIDLADTCRKMAEELHRAEPPTDFSSPSIRALGCYITEEKNSAITAGNIKLADAWFLAWHAYTSGQVLAGAVGGQQ